MDKLRDILREEVRYYAADGVGVRSFLYPILDDANQTYCVIAVGNPRGVYLEKPLIVVMAHIKDNHIIIEVDNTDKPLFKALVHEGVPRDRIICAYAGDQSPEPVDASGD